MDITVQTVVSIGILMTEIPTADSIAAIMDITITPEKDRAACHIRAKSQALRKVKFCAELVTVS